MSHSRVTIFTYSDMEEATERASEQSYREGLIVGTIISGISVTIVGAIVLMLT